MIKWTIRDCLPEESQVQYLTSRGAEYYMSIMELRWGGSLPDVASWLPSHDPFSCWLGQKYCMEYSRPLINWQSLAHYPDKIIFICAHFGARAMHEYQTFMNTRPPALSPPLVQALVVDEPYLTVPSAGFTVNSVRTPVYCQWEYQRKNLN